MCPSPKKKHSKRNSTSSSPNIFDGQPRMFTGTSLVTVVREYCGGRVIIPTIFQEDVFLLDTMSGTVIQVVGGAIDSWVEISKPTRSGSKTNTVWVYSNSWKQKNKKSSATSPMKKRSRSTKKSYLPFRIWEKRFTMNVLGASVCTRSRTEWVKNNSRNRYSVQEIAGLCGLFPALKLLNQTDE